MDYIIQYIPERLRNYYIYIGPDQCKALGYKSERLESALKSMPALITRADLSVQVEKEIKNYFKPGEKYLLK